MTLTLPRLLSDNAVLQRDKPVTIWGWADTGEKIRVRCAGREAVTQATDGRWRVTLAPLPAGGPYQLEVAGHNQLLCRNLLAGDVWIAAGQSNMELPLHRVRYAYPRELTETVCLAIRQFIVPLSYAYNGERQDFAQGSWQAATPDNLAHFSALAFFFARRLQAEIGVPIGVIVIPVGGSPIEAWLSAEMLNGYPYYADQLRLLQAPHYVQDQLELAAARQAQWHRQLDAADKGRRENWASRPQPPHEWQAMLVPGAIPEQQEAVTPGSFWLKKTFSLTAAQAARKATLWLGVIVDADQIYLNGQYVGQTDYRYPPRIYHVPEGLLHVGENELTIRIISFTGTAELVPDKRYELVFNDIDAVDEILSLAGQWRYRRAARVPPLPQPFFAQYQPATLFNARLAPTLPMTVTGIIWYQGESNAERGGADVENYHDLFIRLIQGWRQRFGDADLPFLFVQLANYLPAAEQPQESDRARVREAQRQALALANTAMTVTIDVGEWNDLHPLDKQTVGDRLARCALQVVFQRNELASGPVLTRLVAQGDRLILHFACVGQGLRLAAGDQLGHIAIAGRDKRFVWAQAQVEDARIVVWANSVPAPRWVRYGWADNPAGANLCNSAGLPASPFEAEAAEPTDNAAQP